MAGRMFGRIDISLNLVAILPVTVQCIDVVTSHTASHRPLFRFHADGTIARCAYNLWRVYNYNYIARKIFWGNFFHTENFLHEHFFMKIY